MRMTIVTRFAAVCVFQILKKEKKEKLEIGLGGPSLALLKIPSLSLRAEWVWMWNLYGYFKSETVREEEGQGRKVTNLG